MTDLTLMLIRVAVLVLPAGFACFILGFFYGRGRGYETGYNAGIKMTEILSPDLPRRTTMTSRNHKTEI